MCEALMEPESGRGSVGKRSGTSLGPLCGARVDHRAIPETRWAQERPTARGGVRAGGRASSQPPNTRTPPSPCNSPGRPRLIRPNCEEFGGIGPVIPLNSGLEAGHAYVI